MVNDKESLFTLDGQNLKFTFILVCSLFLLWAVCNGMIDVMDKHFQEELHLSKSQSAWVQFAHYLGYFLMSMPAGILATKLGYKRGIIMGLSIVALGGFWFIPATHINSLVHEGAVTATTAFIGFLAGVCVIATGLTFLETIANPYTTVLGPKRFAATRINLAQSCNGAGWIIGPPIGGLFFYGKDAMGNNTGQPDPVHSLCDRGDHCIDDRGGILFRQRARHQDAGRLPPGRKRSAGFALHLVASALRAGGSGTVFLRGRAGRHFQLFHQLHDGGTAADSGLVGLRGISAQLGGNRQDGHSLAER